MLERLKKKPASKSCVLIYLNFNQERLVFKVNPNIWAMRAMRNRRGMFFSDLALATYPRFQPAESFFSALLLRH